MAPTTERDGVVGPQREAGAALRLLRSRELVLLLIGIGILLRVAQYLANRSLWIDEASLALNLIERPLSGLTRPLDFNQAAPIGFLVVERIVGKALGFSEYVLRLFPFLCGLASVPAFAWLARRMLAEAAPFAILLFVVADGLIYYSSEVKPYETDVAAAVALLAAGAVLADAPRRARTALIIAVAGLAAVTFSFSAALVMAAVTVVLAFRLLFDRQRHLRSPATFAVLLWSFAAIGIAVFSKTTVWHVRESFESDSGRFLGVTGSSSPLHVLNTIGTQMAVALGLPVQPPFNRIGVLAFLLVVLGAVALLRRNRTHVSMLVLPFAFLVGASAAHVYPISERTELFLVPAVVLLVAEGGAKVVRWAPTRARAAIVLLLTVSVAGSPVLLAGKRLVHPRTKEEMKPVLEFIRDHWHPGDTLYVHYGSQYALLYYEECKCLDLSRPNGRRDLWPLRPLQGDTNQWAQAGIPLASDVLVGRYFAGDTRRYVEDLDRVRTRRRVWFLYSHYAEWERGIVQDALLGHLGVIGKRIEGIDRPGAHAYLYRIRS
jgi:hypothetical protein